MKGRRLKQQRQEKIKKRCKTKTNGKKRKKNKE